MKNLIRTIINNKDALNQSGGKNVLFEINEEERQKLQAALLEMYCDIYEVCKKHKLTLFLCGGSALGAVRHHGFIPWDDDLDTAMTREDYSKFVAMFQNELSEKYELVAPNYQRTARSRFPKVLKKGTLFREATDCSSDPQHCGIFIDIFLIENVPENRLVRKIQGNYCNLLEFIGGKVSIYENRCDKLKELYDKVSPRSYAVNLAIGKIFSFIKSELWYNHIDRVVRCKDEHSTECSLPTGRKHYFGEILPRSTFFPGQQVYFAGREAMVFEDVDYYLRNLYGDYMIVPEPDKRESHFIVEMDLNYSSKELKD